MTQEELSNELQHRMYSQKGSEMEEDEEDYINFCCFLLKNMNPDDDKFCCLSMNNQPVTWIRPLHYAACDHDLVMCKLLMEFGADPTLLSDNDKLPSYYAVDKNLIDYLKEAEEKRSLKRARIEDEDENK